MNVIGERQHPEKYIPMCIKRLWRGCYLHVPTETKAGSRHYIHASDVAEYVVLVKLHMQAN